ncbi:MAG: PhoH family protein, partial [Planctomycetia bacterium]
MSRTSIAVLDSKRLVAIFGPRDQHLRRIRSTLGVGVSARDDTIQIEGDEPAVLRAAEVFEELDRIARDHGAVEPEEVTRLLAKVADPAGRPAPDPIEVARPGRPLVPKSAGQAAYVQAIRDHDIVLCPGPAGSGKPFLAVALAEASLRAGQVRK